MEKSSFFNSVNGDRKYKASDFAEYFNSLLTNGVFPNPSTNLQVIANSNMTVTLKAGKAWINGYFYYNTDDLILSIDVADGVLNRIDRIVLKMDTINRNITAVVKKGTFASSPVAQTLQQDADAYELGIADVYVGHGVTSISQVNITDLRMNTTLCGWVNSLIQADTTAIFNQYLDWYTNKTGEYQTDIDNMEAQFQNDWNTWFSTVQSALDGDTAGNLLNQINNLAGAGRTTETVKGNADAIASHEADNTYQTAGGTATAIILTIGETLSDGLPVNFKCASSNSGASTTINGKPFYKPGGTTAPNLIAGKYYTAVYNSASDCFFIKASAEGNAVAANVLAGKTFSNDSDTGLTGTIPSKSAQTYTPGTTNQTIASGQYLSGNQTISGDADLIASNILSGKSIFGVAGAAIPINLTPGDTVLVDDTTSYAAPTNGTLAKLGKRITMLNQPGRVRIRFTAEANVNLTLGTARVYKNGSPIGTLRNLPANNTQYTFAEDFDFVPNDYFEVYCQQSSNASMRVYLMDFQACYAAPPNLISMA